MFYGTISLSYFTITPNFSVVELSFEKSSYYWNITKRISCLVFTRCLISCTSYISTTTSSSSVLTTTSSSSVLTTTSSSSVLTTTSSSSVLTSSCISSCHITSCVSGLFFFQSLRKSSTWISYITAVL